MGLRQIMKRKSISDSRSVENISYSGERTIFLWRNKVSSQSRDVTNQL